MHCGYPLLNERCGKTATEVILWGCLNQHLMEFPTCLMHTHEWLSEYHTQQINCAYCYKPAAAYLTVDAKHVTPGISLTNVP